MDGRRLALKINSEMKSAELSVGWCIHLYALVHTDANMLTHTLLNSYKTTCDPPGPLDLILEMSCKKLCALEAGDK